MNNWIKHDLKGLTRTAEQGRVLYELKVSPSVCCTYTDKPDVMHIIFDCPDGKRKWFEIHADKRSETNNLTESQLLEWCILNRNGFSEWQPSKP